MIRPKNESPDQKEEETPTPPGAPDRTPVEDPDRSENPPMGDPQKPSKKRPRLQE